MKRVISFSERKIKIRNRPYLPHVFCLPSFLPPNLIHFIHDRHLVYYLLENGRYNYFYRAGKPVESIFPTRRTIIMIPRSSR